MRHRSFRLLFFGQVVSNVGDWLDFLALAALVAYRWGLGPAALAAVTAARLIPPAVCGPIAGVWADRLPRRTLMIACDLLRAGLVLGLVWAPNLYAIMALVVAKGAASAFFDPAQQGAIRTLVPKEHLLGANSLSTLSLQVTKVVSLTLGGILVTAAGPQAAFVADAISFVLSALFLSRLPSEHAGSRPQAGGSFWADFHAGVKYVAKNRVLKLAMGCMAAGYFIIFFYDGLLPLLTRTAGIGESGFGLVVSVVSLGGILGALAAGQWGRGLNPLWTMVACSVVSGSCVAGAGLGGLGWGWGPPILWQAAMWLLAGLSGGALQVFLAYLLQSETPQSLMGRVWSLARTVQGALPFLAPLLGAVAAAGVGVGGVFVLGGLGYITMGVVVGLLIRWRRIRPSRGVAGDGAASSKQAAG